VTKCSVFMLAAVASVALADDRMVFEDSEFLDSAWSVFVYNTTNDSTQSASQQSVGGNGGAFRQMTHVLPSPSSIGVFHFRSDWTVPAADFGRLEIISMTHDRIVNAPAFQGAAVGEGLMIRQGASIFFISASATSTTVWDGGVVTGSLDDLLPIGDAVLDTDAAAPDVVLGYFKSNTNSSTVGAARINGHGVDNLRIEVTLADQGCSAADLAEPFGVLDLGDTDAFIAAFLSQGLLADIAPPAGVLDLGDIDAFIAAFLGGCP